MASEDGNDIPAAAPSHVVTLNAAYFDGAVHCAQFSVLNAR